MIFDHFRGGGPSGSEAAKVNATGLQELSVRESGQFVIVGGRLGCRAISKQTGGAEGLPMPMLELS